MNAILLKSPSKNKINLFYEFAKEFGLKAKILSEQEIEDIGLGNAVKSGRTGEFIDTQEFLNSLGSK